jgi:hypothetical protein
MTKHHTTADGRHFIIPDDHQRPFSDNTPCDCHAQMGNDFYFLPIDACLRKDKTCNKPRIT